MATANKKYRQHRVAATFTALDEVRELMERHIDTDLAIAADDLREGRYGEAEEFIDFALERLDWARGQLRKSKRYMYVEKQIEAGEKIEA